MSRRRTTCAGLFLGLVASLLLQPTAPASSVVPAAPVETPLTECRDLDGQRYCLGVGFTERSEQQVEAALQASARTAARTVARRTGVETTGDLDALALLQRRTAMSPAERRRSDEAEFAAAARAAHKVAALRAPKKKASQYSRRFTMLKGKRTRQQYRTYWCGPATVQSIVWGWRKRKQRQKLWAERLGTTRSGSAITELVRVVNNNTGYDRPDRAGPYIVLDISTWSFDDWWLLMMRHLEDYRAPVILHPVLEKRFYPYLDDDASGHFQVGRGFDKNPGGQPLLGYFEPWNQRRFDPSEPYIRRVQWQPAYPQYRANQAHFQHNVGV